MADIIKLAEAVAAEISTPVEAEVMYAPELDLKGIKEHKVSKDQKEIHLP